MMRKLLTLLFFTLTSCLTVWGQGSQLPFGNPAYRMINRLHIQYGGELPFHPSLQGYTRGEVTRYALQLDTSMAMLSILDRHDLNYIFLDNNEWLAGSPDALSLAEKKDSSFRAPIELSMASAYYQYSRKPLLGIFYTTPANLYEVNTPAFQLRVNPMLDLKMGAIDNEDDMYFLNRRGLEIRGGLDDRIYFYTNIVESQGHFPAYVRSYVNKFEALPGNGLYKGFEDDLFGYKNGYDFLNSQGYLGFNLSTHFGAQLGYGKNKIGNGYRSMLLSDFSNNYFYLKLNWQVWKFHYQNIFAELSANTARGVPGSGLIPKKYMATHYLGIHLLPNLQIGLFESVVFNRQNQFELQYLNPFILYRAVEHGLGSPDNVMLGLDGSWTFLRQFQLYGQFFMDEFKLSEVTGGEGWWGNKFAGQLGLKYINVGRIDHLDMQIEYNAARPYSYAHFDASSWTHYNQPLAHPLGANFREWVLLASYQPLPRLRFDGRLLHMTYGEDPTGKNFGSNILLSYNEREKDFGNEIAQGIRTQTLTIGLNVSYMLRHNLFLEGQLLMREKDSAQNELDERTMWVGGGIRWNIEPMRFDF